MKPDPGRFIEVNGVSLYVEEHGAGVPMLASGMRITPARRRR